MTIPQNRTLSAALLMALLCSAATASGEYSPASMAALIEADWVDEDDAFIERQTATPAEPATTAEDAAGGCDGIKNGGYGFHVASGETDPWWQVDLGQLHTLDRVVVFNRTAGVAPERTRAVQVLVSEDGIDFRTVYEHNGDVFYGVLEDKPLVVAFANQDVRARFVRLRIPGKCSFALDEVEVYPRQAPNENVALGRPADQKSVSPYSTRKSPASADVTSRFSLAHTHEILEQGRQLALRLALSETATAAALDNVERRLAEAERSGMAEIEARRTLYFDARGAKRAIAFQNPLLDMDAILFVKRHDAKGVFHMCDQYYGFNSVAGGGLFVLSNPFGKAPAIRNVLEGAALENGRLAGHALTPGAFLSPELSFDGHTIFFAYSQAQGADLEWSPESSFHVFRIEVDGSQLRQLTDGPWNDFDPCVLPDGRIAFISERRGGYLRCGRHCPTYTLHAMADDGSGIICLSWHETHEWHPSVTHDGMIVYTRWDYVDRDTNVAHHIWTCYPDGRDPRAYHGNYPERREGRPWMEMSIRAVPDSHKFVATAAAHHGHAFGSLVLIDQRVEDDGAMAQLTRLTPEVPFPEAERHIKPIADCMVYGTPWPLSEDDYLCVYDRHAKNWGIYWIDRFGNRELLYRDPEIACLSPIPLRPRPRPPIIPIQTHQVAEVNPADSTGVVAVMNIYDGDFEWPADTRIAALRVIQVLPKTTPPPNEPRIGVAEQTNARAVLGTVPVESDGSALFEVPAGRQIYFQALDDRGMAIQSMRSGTYVHPGERLTCLGCHEPKRLAVETTEARVPLALRRSPSPLEPGPEGSSPFSYVRLVQPVLDRHCVACHVEKQAVDLRGNIEGDYGWSRSYTNLAEDYGFYYHVRNGSMNTGIHGGVRSVAGQFGARVAPLLEYLDRRHYDVNLDDADFRRVALWLDCNSEFFGSYENTEAQSRGEEVMPTLF
ncbi:MAG TPA: discoidin domain-containing protein [Candidatus Hydrogenedentes bacterium]|nr:discoidin domain-containing protein [Candidatus Hydrogenedentota bacterium]HPG65254.1 discoidin domain-containing protein [Candidatus Hydrogenedentota bacterium]